MIENFIRDLTQIYRDILNNRFIDIDDFKGKWDIKSSIGDTYQQLCKKDLKREMGSFYTPMEIVDYMVDELLKNVDYGKDPYIKILDPSCGGGYFLIAIYKKLMEKALELNILNIEQHILKNNIYGFDNDENAIMITVVEFYEITGCFAENITACDYLTKDTIKFDIIIGNPPYMGHKVLIGEYREELYKLYGQVFFDKGDISYCFIKKSIDSLKSKGTLMFFTSRYILEALNGYGIRNYIKNMGFVKSIIDFYGIRVVKGAGVDNIIFEFIKDEDEPKPYTNVFRLNKNASGIGSRVFEDIQNKSFLYVKNMKVCYAELPSSGWVFINDIEISIINRIKGTAMSNICQSFQGIISGLDKAFVLKVEDAKNLDIEKEVLKPWIKNKNIYRFGVTKPDEVIIYLNSTKDENKYPYAIKYIKGHCKRLMERRECKAGSKKWYHLQWGRDRELFENTKIIYPYKASSNKFAIDNENYFSADIYAIKIMDIFQNKITYEFLVGILNSSLYEFYIKSMSKKLGEDMYDYYPNKIMTLKIPDYIEKIDIEVRNGGENLRDRIDLILNEYFNITDEEYGVIRNWCK